MSDQELREKLALVLDAGMAKGWTHGASAPCLLVMDGIRWILGQPTHFYDERQIRETAAELPVIREKERKKEAEAAARSKEARRKLWAELDAEFGS